MPEQNKDKVYWHSRRGMLELDLLLMPFAKEVFEGLSDEEKLLYIQLLEQEDQELYSWLMERSQPDDPGLKTIISRILAHNARSA